MSEYPLMADIQMLAALTEGNPDLKHLETLLDEFNIFEAVGMIRQELRHSDFLAFLLDPRQTHGLGDMFVTQFLQRAFYGQQKSISLLIDGDKYSAEWGEIEVRREWRNIDILLILPSQRLVVVIENKIDSFEHSGQLERYWNIVRQHWPDWRILGLYLTVEGVPANNVHYRSVSYKLIGDLIHELLETVTTPPRPDVRTLLFHYVQMLRRHIMNDSEIAELCRRIYREHQRALDLIFEHRPDLQAQVRDIVVRIITDTPGLLVNGSRKSYVTFVPKSWLHSRLATSYVWADDGSMLYFEFQNRPDHLQLLLAIGPGDSAMRQALYELAQASEIVKPFRVLGKEYNTVYKQTFLVPKDYQNAGFAELEQKILERWEQFINNDFPLIKNEIEQVTWIWSENSDA